jgi:hypothetical protein
VNSKSHIQDSSVFDPLLFPLSPEQKSQFPFHAWALASHTHKNKFADPDRSALHFGVRRLDAAIALRSFYSRFTIYGPLNCLLFAVY